MLGNILAVILLGAAILAVIGYLQLKCGKKKGAQEEVFGTKDIAEDEALNQKTVDHVLDLNDRFNRAPYMDKDK